METLIFGNCLEEYKIITKGSVNLILCDPPYGTTACLWDAIIPFSDMWNLINYVKTPNANILLFGNQPFTTQLISSNIKEFKQHLIWNKNKGSNPLLAKKRIMQSHEDIILFNSGKAIYNPQMTIGKPYKAPRTSGSHTNKIVGNIKNNSEWKQEDNSGTRYPLSVLSYSMHCGSKIHPTQKPTELLKYLIKTYSNENDTVLDFTMGNGSTGVACNETNRRFIEIENNKEYFELAQRRINIH